MAHDDVEAEARCEIVRKIINKFGGTRPLAGLTGLAESTIVRWYLPRGRNGTGGIIPADRQIQLLQLAHAHGIALGPADFFLPNDTSIGSVAAE